MALAARPVLATQGHPALILQGQARRPRCYRDATPDFAWPFDSHRQTDRQDRGKRMGQPGEDQGCAGCVVVVVTVRSGH